MTIETIENIKKYKLLRNRLWNDLINNKEYIARKNIFNRGNKNKLYYIDFIISMFLFYYIELTLSHRMTIQKGGKDKNQKNSRIQ